MGDFSKRDFRKSVIYQIYPKSFQDSNGDGLGDLRGIVKRLDYLQFLGVDLLWLTPFFVSPQRDNGYDVADYYAVDARFGSMVDLELLIAEAGKRGMGLMLDMVFNHTSTEHSWFKRALQGEKRYQDYYIFREGSPDTPPTNWQSKFGGSAWAYVPRLGKWYLHLYDRTQADLNWDNPEVREALKEVLRFWKAKGIEGFRFDVVNLISKPPVFEDDVEGDGRRFYTDGPRIHEYLKELVRDAGLEHMVTVGEMSSTSLAACQRYADPAERELNMCFNFHHLKIDYAQGDKWALQTPDLRQLKRLFAEWQEGMQDKQAWNALFWCNHDQPRIVSRLGDEDEHWDASAKLLGGLIHLMRGTPYIYQGEELGMLNAHFTSLAEYRDVESLNYYDILLRSHSEQEALKILGARSRDNARTPMQWSEAANGGFSEAEPWIPMGRCRADITAEAQCGEPNSVFSFYRRLIALRKEMALIAEGSIRFLPTEADALFLFERHLDGEQLIVLANLSAEPLGLNTAPGGELLLCNYPDFGEEKELRPFELRALLS